jgi:hypothetical protein
VCALIWSAGARPIYPPGFDYSDRAGWSTQCGSKAARQRDGRRRARRRLAPATEQAATMLRRDLAVAAWCASGSIRHSPYAPQIALRIAKQRDYRANRANTRCVALSRAVAGAATRTVLATV